MKIKKWTLASLISGITCLILVVIALPNLNSVWAADDYDWKFNIPVKMQDLDPAIGSLFLILTIMDSNGNAIPVTGEVNAIPGEANVYITVPMPSDGNLNTTIEKKVKAKNPSDRSKANKYKISLRLWTGYKSQIGLAPNEPGEEAAKSKPGTKLVKEVEGKLEPGGFINLEAAKMAYKGP